MWLIWSPKSWLLQPTAHSCCSCCCQQLVAADTAITDREVGTTYLCSTSGLPSFAAKGMSSFFAAKVCSAAATSESCFVSRQRHLQACMCVSPCEVQPHSTTKKREHNSAENACSSLGTQGQHCFMHGLDPDDRHASDYKSHTLQHHQ